MAVSVVLAVVWYSSYATLAGKMRANAARKTEHKQSSNLTDGVSLSARSSSEKKKKKTKLTKLQTSEIKNMKAANFAKH